jgi:hypothetical protein
MKKRSLSKLFLLNLFTLGIYELFWLSETRQEMVSKYGVKIPSAKIIVFIVGFQLITCLSAFGVFFLAYNQANKVSSSPTVPTPTQQCWLDYAKSNDPQLSASTVLSQQCRRSVDKFYADSDKYYADQTRVFRLFAVFYGLGFAALLSVIFYARWCLHYAAGVAVVTGGKLSKTRAVNYLTLLPPTIRTLLIQDAFNNVPSPSATTDSPIQPTAI